MKAKWLWALLLAIAGVAVYVGNVLATPQSGVTTTQYASKIQFDEIDIQAHTIPADVWQARLKTQGLTDAYVVDNKIAVGGTTGWHSHPGPSLIMVVAGSVTNYLGDDPTCTGHTYSAGQGFIDEGSGDVHMLRNEGTVPAETIAVQLLPKDAPRRIDVPDPGNCNF
jgi:quercetin dioxygenase-like cupin family protein